MSSKLGIMVVVIAAMALVSCGLSIESIENFAQEAFVHLDNSIEGRQHGWRTVVLPFTGLKNKLSAVPLEHYES